MKALIAGAGIGGLTAALALNKAGFDVHVFERTSALSEIGAGIQMSPNGVRVLHQLGLADQLPAVAFRPQAVELRLHKSGFNVSRVALGEDISRRYGFPNFSFHRADLQSLLENTLRERCSDAIKLGCEVSGVTQTASGATLHFSDGRSESGDVVIGCDGIHSKVREILLGAKKPEFTGNVAWRGVVPVARLKGVDLRPVVTSWMAPHSHAVTYFVRGGELMNFVGVTEQSEWATESWSQRGDRRDLLRDFNGWHPTVRAIVENIDEPYRWPLLARQPLAKWSEGHVTLLGDACHPMLPFMAQGAVMAIEDASVLANCLDAGRADIPKALKRYEALRLRRTSRVQAGARAQGQMFHLASPLKRYMKFGTMSLVSRLFPDVAAARNDWLMSYDATAQT